MTKYLKIGLYYLVMACISSAMAGSFEDFFIAVRNDNATVVSDLVQRGFDINTRDAKGQPGLSVAMQQRSLRVAKVLLDQPSVDVNALNAAGETALMLAALKGEVAGVRMLLDKGAQVQQAGWSAIHYAATGPEPQIVQLLLDRGADINASSPNGTTPLMMAAQYGDEKNVALLLQRSADPTRRNQGDLRAPDFARLAGREALAKRLDALLR